MAPESPRREFPGRARTHAAQYACCALILPAICAVTLGTPAGAAASTVTLRADPNSSRDTLVYHAFPGEANTVQASFAYLAIANDDRAAWTITDSGAVIVAATPCRNTDPHTVTCVASEDRFIGFARFELGDLDDRFHSEDSSEENRGLVNAFGGPGDDTLAAEHDGNMLYGDDGNDTLSVALASTSEAALLKGGRGDDRLVGGPGFDQLDGGGGRDELYGGDSEDLLTDGDRDGAAGVLGPGPDLLDGGPGDCCLTDGGDRVIYSARTDPVRVDLADRESDGAAGEGDTLVGVESVHGGRGDDLLSGSDRENTLYGGAGRDRLTGRGAADMIRTGTGGGSVSCGAGPDRVEPRSGDHLAPDCEGIDGQRIGIYYVLAYPTTRGSGALGYRLSCPDGKYEDRSGVERCSATVQFRDGSGRLLAAGVLPAGRWENTVITLQVTTRGRRLAARRDGVRAWVRLAYQSGNGTRASRRSIRWGVQFQRHR